MRNTFKALFGALIIGLFIIRPASSYADWNGHDRDWHGHDHDRDWHGHDHDRDWYGRHHSYIGVNLSVWPDNYYYYNVPYYPPANVVLVAPPIYQPVNVNGYTYVQPPVVVDSQLLPADLFTINIPNARGGYTAVTLKKSGNGYAGPQGEFYSEFPTVFQLQVIYGK